MKHEPPVAKRTPGRVTRARHYISPPHVVSHPVQRDNSYLIGHVCLLLRIISRTQLPLLSHVVHHTVQTDEWYLFGHVYLLL